MAAERLCRGCKEVHDLLLRCEVARRRKEAAGVFSLVPSRVTPLDAEVAVVDVVVDTAEGGKRAVVDMANTRTRDRHRKTAVRREYLRVKQRESRARRQAAGAAT